MSSIFSNLAERASHTAPPDENYPGAGGGPDRRSAVRHQRGTPAYDLEQSVVNRVPAVRKPLSHFLFTYATKLQTHVRGNKTRRRTTGEGAQAPTEPGRPAEPRSRRRAPGTRRLRGRRCSRAAPSARARAGGGPAAWGRARGTCSPAPRGRRRPRPDRPDPPQLPFGNDEPLHLCLFLIFQKLHLPAV